MGTITHLLGKSTIDATPDKGTQNKKGASSGLRWGDNRMMGGEGGGMKNNKKKKKREWER